MDLRGAGLGDRGELEADPFSRAPCLQAGTRQSLGSEAHEQINPSPVSGIGIASPRLEAKAGLSSYSIFGTFHNCGSLNMQEPSSYNHAPPPNPVVSRLPVFLKQHATRQHLIL